MVFPVLRSVVVGVGVRLCAVRCAQRLCYTVLPLGAVCPRCHGEGLKVKV